MNSLSIHPLRPFFVEEKAQVRKVQVSARKVTQTGNKVGWDGMLWVNRVECDRRGQVGGYL